MRPLRRYNGCLAKAIRLLDRLVRMQDIPPDYMYYGIPSPWLQALTTLSCRRTSELAAGRLRLRML